MFDRIRQVLLRFSRVPPEPAPPFGAPGSVRVFRASGNYYKLRLLGWGIGQLGALAGIVFSLWFFHEVESATETVQRHAARATNTPPASVAGTDGGPVAEAGGRDRRGASLREGRLWAIVQRGRSREAAVAAAGPVYT